MPLSNRQIFLQHNGQTTHFPLCFEISHAQGVYLYDVAGKKYIDAIGGISVANVGHGVPQVLETIQAQSQKYLHTMVYGEMVQAPQVLYAQALATHLPTSLNNVFFTNSGAEAIEGAMKLAKRVTQKTNFIACNNSYHGSTQGALSMIGSEYWKNAYRPLLPNIFHYNYNSDELIDGINEQTAAVFIEPVQAESGVLAARKEWLQAIAHKCKQVAALLVFDESQTGFGRTGALFALNHFDITPDVLVLAKAIGGGLPLGAFIADKQLMMQLADAPILGNISTFAGHPLSCAAGLAAFNYLIENNLVSTVTDKGKYLAKKIEAIGIECYRQEGLWMALFFKDFDTTKQIVDQCIANGVFTDWFLFASNALRLSPPLSITYDELDEMVAIIEQSVQKVLG
jgi:acetylornithine/N-succinyldiaminopimelate aminotransferase